MTQRNGHNTPDEIWEKIRERVCRGETMAAAGEAFGVSAEAVRMRASRSRESWNVSELKAMRKSERLGRGDEIARQVELEVIELGSAMSHASGRCKAMLSESVVKALGALQTLSPGELAASHRVLVSLEAVCSRLFRWHEEPSQSELERMKTGVVNLPLIRTTPQELKKMHQEKTAGAGGLRRAQSSRSGALERNSRGNGTLSVDRRRGAGRVEGEISRDLEKDVGGRPSKETLLSDGKSKAETTTAVPAASRASETDAERKRKEDRAEWRSAAWENFR